MNSDAAEAALGLLGLSPNNVPATPQLIPLKRKQSTQTLAVPTDEFAFNPDAINCICGFGYDDGFSIACDNCSRWCHAACFDIVEGEVPEEWACWMCVPRPVDRDKAVKLQRARQKQVQEMEQQRVPRVSPGADRKPRRASAAAIDGSKRKRRSSINTPLLQQQQQSQPQPPTEDEHVDIDEPWTYSYVPITKDIVPQQDTRDKLQRQAQHWRGITALAPVPVYQDPPPTTILPLPKSSFSHPTLSLNTNPSVRPPSYAMHTTTPIASSHFITPYTSTIIPTSAYLSDPLNAYAHLGMPKPFVHLLGHPLDVTLDARITGDKGRFVRSGCKPNAVLRPVICPKAKQTDSDPETISFGVFALRDLKAHEEVVLGWEWDDGNAVHSLPALIENPYAFPALDGDSNTNSPAQLEHLRYQMMSILHTLSSTFTTCACGAKATDCALSQMAAFVDGELPKDSGEGSVDLGPLVGSIRGFRTREKVPMSGGMSGVEMDIESDEPVAGPSTIRHERRHTVDNVAYAFRSSDEQYHHSNHESPGARRISLPTLTFSPATASPSPKKIKSWKGKERATSNSRTQEEGDDEEDSFSSRGSQGFMRTGQEGRSQVRQHVTINYSASSPAHQLDVGEAMQIIEEEDKMPPKMRKRWIQRSSEILKDIMRQSPASPESVASPGSSNNESGTGADDGDDWMDVDEMPSGPDSSSCPEEARSVHPVDPKEMTQSSTPIPLDSTTVFSMKPSAIAIIHANSPNENLAASPSASFAKLSLMSPILPSLSPSPSPNTLPHAVPRYNTSSPSPLSQNGEAPSVTNDCPLTVQQDHVDAYRSIAGPSSLRLQGTSPEPALKANANASEPTHRTFPRPPLPTFILEEQCVSEGTGTSQELPMQPLDGSRLLRANDGFSQAATDILGSSSHRETPSAPPPPPPPPTSKVKLTLKDFALRKKRQREEEMARAVSPPKGAGVVLELGTSVGSKVHGANVEMNGNGDVNGNSEANIVPKMDENIDMSVDPHDMSPGVDARYSASPIPKDDAHILHVDKPPTLDNPTNQMHSSLTSSAPVMLNDTQHRTPNGADSVKAEIGTVDAPILVAFVPQDLNAKNSSPEPPPNGPAVDRGSNQTIGDMSILSSHIRRLSQEDGEIQSFMPPKQPHFVLGTHTPPTQPRSFHNVPTSPNSIASPSTRRLSQPPPLRPNRSSTTSGPVSRPLPSGPRALRAANHLGSSPIVLPNRSFSGPHLIPRGPSADRERLDWDRDRHWPTRPRGRGIGGGGWGR